MRYRSFKVTLFKGFKQVAVCRVISGSQDGATIKEMEYYCKNKFIGRNVKIEV